MARGKRNEKVTTTFHFLMRVKKDGEKSVPVPISLNEFTAAMAELMAMPPVDTSTQAAVDKIRFAPTAPVQNVQKIDNNLYFGKYKAVYSGHAYENTARGLIPHDSASLRTFSFLVYRSHASGRIYVATQYLGQFGDYVGLARTIKDSFANKKGLESHSIRSVSNSFQQVKAKEVVVDYMRQPDKISKSNAFGKRATVVIKSTGDGTEFQEEARKRLFGLLGGPIEAVKKEVAKILKEDQLISISDADIINCTVLADVNGAEKRYYFINDNSFATHFNLGVSPGLDGHPDEDQVKKQMLALLQNEIIAKSQHV